MVRFAVYFYYNYICAIYSRLSIRGNLLKIIALSPENEHIEVFFSSHHTPPQTLFGFTNCPNRRPEILIVSLLS